MNCPVDTTLLVIAEHQDLEIDLCPVCRGVWLDRGELDKLIDAVQDGQPNPVLELVHPAPPASTDPNRS